MTRLAHALYTLAALAALAALVPAALATSLGVPTPGWLIWPLALAALAALGAFAARSVAVWQATRTARQLAPRQLAE